MIKKVHDVLIYQRTYHKDIATRFSPREEFEDLVFTSKTNNPIITGFSQSDLFWPISSLV